MRGRLAVLAGLMLAVTGCAQNSPVRAPEVNPVWRSCPADRRPAPADTRLAADFVPVAVVLCRTVDRKRPGGGTDLTAVEDRATDVAGLVTALRLPDERRSSGACTSDLVVPPWLALIDGQGRWVQPGVPQDGCNHPRRELATAVLALHTTRVSSRVLNTVVSDGAAASGCGQDYSDMAWAVLHNTRSRTAAPAVVPTPTAAVEVCVFRVPAAERGGPKPGGQYESSRTLTPEQWTAVRHELAVAGPPAPCPTSAARIAVLPAGTVVELDGCRMVLVGGTVRQGTPALVRLLQPAR